MEQTFSIPQVYLLFVETKTTRRIRRVEVFQVFEQADKRRNTMHLESDERARIEARKFFGQ